MCVSVSKGGGRGVDHGTFPHSTHTGTHTFPASNLEAKLSLNLNLGVHFASLRLERTEMAAGHARSFLVFCSACLFA